MTTRTKPSRSWLVVLFACIFGLVASGCAGSASSEAAPAKSPAGYEASGVPYSAGEPAPAEASADLDEAEPNAEMPSLLRGAVAQGGPARAVPKSEASDAPEPPPVAPPIPAPTPNPSPAPTPPAAPGREPLLIYTATMTLAVFDTKNAIDAVEELARSRGGYLVSRADQTVTVRVPTKAFQGALGGVSKLGDELHRQVNVRDVTEQFADLEIRLKNAEAVRERLQALLAKAAKIEDALAVERELERITQTIEQMKGRLRLLGELIAFSTITVNFQARPQDQVGSEVRLPFDWLRELGLPPLLNLEAP
jgi:hypothetical protein